jgi:hypothetical protein
MGLYNRIRSVELLGCAIERFKRLTGIDHDGRCDRCREAFTESDEVEITPRKYLVLLYHAKGC